MSHLSSSTPPLTSSTTICAQSGGVNLSDSSIHLIRSSHDGRTNSNTKRSDDGDATNYHCSTSAATTAHTTPAASARAAIASLYTIQAMTALIPNATQRAMTATAAAATATADSFRCYFLPRPASSDVSSLLTR
jgi:hypothetical protein